MPLEVTPVPFVEQQLPYNPKFIREPEIRENGEGSLPGGAGGSIVSGPGPLAAASSALIPPVPGGVAGPHNAIPALPDAGYTAPGIRTTGLGLDLGGGSSARSSLSDGYGPMGPGSMMRPGTYAASGFAPEAFGHMPRGAPPVPMSTISSHSWAGGGQSTFPGPRRASNPALVPSLAESTIAPRGVSQHGGQAIDPRHQRQLEVPAPHSHHHSQRHRRSHSGPRDLRSEADDWDAKSDASYYARPKPNRARSGSTLSDITSSTSTARPPPPHHHHSFHRDQKGSPGQHEHSPISPSPLARDGPSHHRYSHSQPGPSPLSPTAHVGTRHKKISGVDTTAGGGDGALPPPQASPYRRVTPIAPDLDFAPGELTPLREASERGGRRYSTSFGSDGGYDTGRRRLGSPHGYASDDEGRYSSRSRTARREKSRHRHDDGLSSHHSVSRRSHKHVAEAYPDDEYDHPPHLSRSHSRVPPPMQYRAPSPNVPVPHQHQLMPDIGSLSISGEPRRRAQSMQHGPGGLPVSSPASLAGFGGGAGMAGGPYQTPSVAGGGEMYDDGGSIAGSAMTFMDGAVAGRTSHYGLPKYPHQAKPDYRRFMVQRGKADVYLD